MKKCVLWTGVKSEESSKKYNYGDFSWMDYSKKTWSHFCKRHGYDFIEFSKSFENEMEMKINWQRWIYLKELIGDKYDAVLSTDASIMTRWDTPDLCQIYIDKFSALRGMENMKWTYESINGYQDMFPDIHVDINDYIASGFIIFYRKHFDFWENVKTFYTKNKYDIIRKEDEFVKRGRDQPVINYLLKLYNIEVNHLSMLFGVNHLYRHELLGTNWQLASIEPDNPMWKLPHFIKYYYNWIFSGFSDRGKTRSNLMSETWNLVKNNYE